MNIIKEETNVQGVDNDNAPSREDIEATRKKLEEARGRGYQELYEDDGPSGFFPIA